MNQDEVDTLKAVAIEDRPTVIDAPVSSLEAGMVFVRVTMAAITGLDRDVIEGRLPFAGVPGSCFVGEVEDAHGPHARRLVGKRVIGVGSYGCGHCEECGGGRDHLCVDRVLTGRVGASGGHAEAVVLPARAVVPVPPTVSDEQAVLVPMVAGIYAGITRARIPEWTNVLVIGDGGAGLLASIAYACAGYTVTVRGKHGDRFDLLRRYNINFNLVGDEGEIDGLRPGRFGPALMSYPYVVEASGEPSGWSAAVELVSPGGSIMLMSSCCDGVPRTVSRIQEKNVRVLGLREGPIDATLSILEEGLFDPSVVVSSVVDFQQVLDGYRRARASDDWMVLLRMRS